MIKEARWSGWVWVGECSFWYRPTRVVPDQRPLNGRCCCCCKMTIESRDINWSHHWKFGSGQSYNAWKFGSGSVSETRVCLVQFSIAHIKVWVPFDSEIHFCFHLRLSQTHITGYSFRWESNPGCGNQSWTAWARFSLVQVRPDRQSSSYDSS